VGCTPVACRRCCIIAKDGRDWSSPPSPAHVFGEEVEATSPRSSSSTLTSVGNFNDEVEGPAPAPEVEGEGPELLALIIPSLVDWVRVPLIIL